MAGNDSSLPDESEEPEESALRVFQINEESSGGGVSCCWVTKRSDGFYLYGNEFGCMAGPCNTVNEALNDSGFEFGMDYWDIQCHVPVRQLAEILASPAFISENTKQVVINKVVVPSCNVSGVVEAYRQWRRGRISDITLIFGPPGELAVQRRIKKRHEETGRPKDELWVELVHVALQNLNARPVPEEPSVIDKLFSDFLKTRVEVHDLFSTYILIGGTRHPALTFYPEKISDKTGWPVAYNWLKPQVQGALSSLFGLLVKSEWVQTSVVHEG